MEKQNNKVPAGPNLQTPTPPESSQILPKEAEHYLNNPGIIEDVPSAEQVKEAEDVEESDKGKKNGQ